MTDRSGKIHRRNENDTSEKARQPHRTFKLLLADVQSEKKNK